MFKQKQIFFTVMASLSLFLLLLLRHSSFLQAPVLRLEEGHLEHSASKPRGTCQGTEGGGGGGEGGESSGIAADFT